MSGTKTETEKTAAVIVSRHQLAGILGVNPDRVSEYTQAGLPVVYAGGRGRGPSRYDAIACAQWVRRHRSGQFDALQERGRRDRALAELAELKLAEQRGRLVDAETVRRDWGDHIGRCRNRLLGLPTAAKTRLPDLTRADVVKLDELVREALEELAARAADDAREFDARDAAKAAAVRLEAAP